MGTIQSFNSGRLQEIENANIVDANVVGGELILTRFDGGLINCGSILTFDGLGEGDGIYIDLADPRNPIIGIDEDTHNAAGMSFAPVAGIPESNVQGAIVNLNDRLQNLFGSTGESLRDRTYDWDDFWGADVASGVLGKLNWTVAQALTGAISIPVAVSSGHRPGWRGLTTGTNAAGHICIHLGVASLHGYDTPFEQRWLLQPTLIASGTENFNLRFGMMDKTDGTEPDNGFYFEYVGTSAGATVKCRTAKAGSRNTAIDTGLPLVASTWKEFVIVGDGGGTIYYYMDDVEVGVESDVTKMPTAASEVYGPCISNTKTLGTTARLTRIDAYYLDWRQAR